MATLTAAERAALRQRLAAEHTGGAITWTKPQVDAALQAIEDWADANAAGLATAINAATQPLGHTFTPAQKARLFLWWCWNRYVRG